jgi:hypothetical protein
MIVFLDRFAQLWSREGRSKLVQLFGRVDPPRGPFCSRHGERNTVEEHELLANTNRIQSSRYQGANEGGKGFDSWSVTAIERARGDYNVPVQCGLSPSAVETLVVNEW